MSTSNVPFEDLHHLCRDSCRDALIAQYQLPIIPRMQSQPFLVPGYWMAMILLAGPDLRLMLKIFFALKTVRHPLTLRLGVNKVEDTLVLDSVKEVLNLAAADIKSFLIESEIQVGMSLPILTRGFDEAFARTSLVQFKTWRMVDTEPGLYVRSSIRVTNPDILDRLQSPRTNEQPSSGFEML